MSALRGCKLLRVGRWIYDDLAYNASLWVRHVFGHFRAFHMKSRVQRHTRFPLETGGRFDPNHFHICGRPSIQSSHDPEVHLLSRRYESDPPPRRWCKKIDFAPTCFQANPKRFSVTSVGNVPVEHVPAACRRAFPIGRAIHFDSPIRTRPFSMPEPRGDSECQRRAHGPGQRDDDGQRSPKDLAPHELLHIHFHAFPQRKTRR